ncbi:hypothetical protein F2P79_005760 [Pimephales promelas]|nr:hypothetical protein F2P79_005760 [Pimephales promelas]
MNNSKNAHVNEHPNCNFWEKDASRRHLKAPERKALGQLFFFKLSWLIVGVLVLACQAFLDVLIEEGRHVVFCTVL